MPYLFFPRFGQFLEDRNRPAEGARHYKAAMAIDPSLREELVPRIKKLS